MALIVVLVLSLVCQSWTAPHWRNWTPQAMLYLKGAPGHRADAERRSRSTVAVPELKYSSDEGLRIFPRIFNVLQRILEQGGNNPYDYLN